MYHVELNRRKHFSSSLGSYIPSSNSHSCPTFAFTGKGHNPDLWLWLDLGIYFSQYQYSVERHDGIEGLQSTCVIGLVLLFLPSLWDMLSLDNYCFFSPEWTRGAEPPQSDPDRWTVETIHPDDPLWPAHSSRRINECSFKKPSLERLFSIVLALANWYNPSPTELGFLPLSWPLQLVCLAGV